MNTKNLNIETRISNRAKSIFASFGQVINDFYLEAGIYFVGGFNAALVSWSIYTDLLVGNQPLPYAVAIAVIAFIAVEGLAVYLVGAAARANSRPLWFFSIVFALFFTYAHYREMTDQGIISEYVTLAIPFFVVVGYWAKTVKIDIENRQESEDQKHDDEAARLHQIEDDDRQLNRQLRLDKRDKNHELKLAEIEVKKVKIDGQNGSFLANNGAKLANANQAKKDKIAYRREQLLTLSTDEKLTQAELAERLGVSVGTIKNDIKAMNGKVKAQ